MTLDEFVKGFQDLFEDTDPAEITPNTEFQELDEWDSLMGISIISFVKTECGKTITGGEIRKSRTVEDLYKLVESE